MRRELTEYIKKKYHAEPEYPWMKYPDNAVFRHEDNKKWFALMMDIRRNTLGIPGDELVSVINLKVDDILMRDMLMQENGIMPAYHMNKLHWISVILDGTVPQDRVHELLDMSYIATASTKQKAKSRPPKEWIIPANPKYYDIEHAFDHADEIEWKQGSGIKTGDTVFMYVGAPVSVILFKCKVTQTDIPYKYEDKNLTITALMKIKLQKRYKADRFTFERLKEDHSIFAVRGPRGIPNSLSEALKK